MNKKNIYMLVVTSLLCLLPTLLILSVFDKLPDQLPTHFNFNGDVDGYTSKTNFLIGAPLFGLVLNLVVNFTVESDPKKFNQSFAMKLIAKFTIPITVIFVTMLTVFTSLGYKIHVNLIVSIFIGLLFIIMGNYLPKTKQNYTMGIKIPWTLNSEDNWNKTHRLAGFLWVVGGFIILVTSLLNITPMLVMIIITSLISIVPCVYSYVIYQKYKS